VSSSKRSLLSSPAKKTELRPREPFRFDETAPFELEVLNVQSSDIPYGTTEVSGISHRRSTLPVSRTVDRLVELLHEAGATVFAVIDQSGAAEGAGQALRNTTLVVFGNPSAGTPVMQAVPLSAMDLPLKVLVWEDDSGQVWMTYLSAEWLAERYGLPTDLARPLGAPDALTGRVASSS
jgi:uncharacterized protein (DUF302 family)